MQNNQKKFKKFKKFPLFMSLGLLGVCLALFSLVYSKIKWNEEVSQKAELEWQTESFRREAIRSLERSIKEIAPERAEIETHFAESQNVVPFLDTLERLASRAGADSEVVSVDIAKEKSELEVMVHITGNFESVYRFIKLLENSPYELIIASFDIQKKEVSEGGGEWDGLFTIHLLSFVK